MDKEMNTSNILAEFTKTLEKENIRIHTFITKYNGDDIEFVIKGEINVIENGTNSRKIKC